MSKRFSLAITLAAAMAVGQSAATAGDYLTLSQPEFITASFEDPAPESAKAAPSCTSCDLGVCDLCNRTDCRCGCWEMGASVEATFLWSNLDASGAATQMVDVGGGIGLITSAGANASDDMMVAPRIWLGAKRDCWGIGGRYWTMQQSSFVTPITQQIYDERALEANTFDLELTRDLCILGSDSMLSFGARHAWLQSRARSDATVTWATAPLGWTTASALNGRDFSGTGITLGLQGTRQIRCSNFHLFWNARGSVLWGEGRAMAIASASVIDGAVGSATETTGAITGNNGDMFIGELQLGLEYQRQLKCAPCIAFARIAGEYQYWDTNAGGQAAAFAVVDTADLAGINYGSAAVASAGDSVLDLFGFSIAAGIKW